MNRLLGRLAVATLAIGAGLAIRGRMRSHVSGRHVPGGILIGDTGAYDTHSRWLLGPLYRGIAKDVATAAPPGARVLEVGCGPGHLSNRLAGEHGLDVTGLDLDPEMIDRANANAAHAKRATARGRRATFVVGDVAALPFDEASFDLVVSTFSMHHWSDPAAGLNDVARVLRPGGRALIWDLKPGCRLVHMHVPDPADVLQYGPLRVVDITPWGWPWRLSLSRRMELARD